MSRFSIGNSTKKYKKCANPDCIEGQDDKAEWFWGDKRDKYCCNTCRIHASNIRSYKKRKKNR